MAGAGVPAATWGKAQPRWNDQAAYKWGKDGEKIIGFYFSVRLAYSEPQECGPQPLSGPIITMRMRFIFLNPAIFLALTGLFAAPSRAQATSTNLTFADDQIACEISTRQEALPELVLATLPIAMKAALEAIGNPSEPVRLAIRLQEPPPFYKRLKSLFRVEAFAVQENDEIRLHAGSDPLKLAFRLGHELSHWLIYKRYSVRPPLWLDKGLAQRIGATAADTCARVHQQDLGRPRPPKLDESLFRLDELIALQTYPTSAARSAAFYWQAEALVRAIHQRLGPAEFAVYFGLLCASDASAWDAPLRERWYFSDWDLNWLAEQIRPDSKSE